MDVSVDLDAPCPPELLFAQVDDLAGYPAWLEIVDRAEPLAAEDADEGGAAWLVDLRGRVGPLARSKRLRMVRTTHDAPRSVRFERRERDDRRHSPWVLEGTVEPTELGSRLVMHLHYGGGFGDAVIERMLTQAIERSKPALLARVS